MAKEITSGQTLTTSWADFGSVIENLNTYEEIATHFDVDANNSTGVKLRLRLLWENDGLSHSSYPIYTTGSSETSVTPHLFSFPDGVDDSYFVSWEINQLAKAGQFQVKCDATGAVVAIVGGRYDAKHRGR